MKQKIEINEWIESFLNGDLPVDERAKFLKKLEEDPDFAHEVELHRQLRYIITDGAYLGIKNDLKLIHLEKTRITKRIKRITGLGMGGLIIGVILLWVLTNTRNTENGKNKQLISVREDSVIIQDQDNPLTENKRETSGMLSLKVSSDDQVTSDESIPDKVLQADSLPATEMIQGEGQVENKVTKPINQVPEPVSEKNPAAGETKEIIKTDCRRIKIEGSFRESESCNNKPTGSIAIDRQSVTGGMAPYTFSLSQVNFSDTLLFSGLYPGNYTLYARDANNCISRIGIALIRSVDCNTTYQAVFAPLRGEIWSIPGDPDRSGTLTIFSKTGALVYSVNFTSGEPITWSGTTLSGQALPMGIYQFEIRYADGSSFIGNVTIVR